jgi:hypothetical protein
MIDQSTTSSGNHSSWFKQNKQLEIRRNNLKFNDINQPLTHLSLLCPVNFDNGKFWKEALEKLVQVSIFVDKRIAL